MEGPFDTTTVDGAGYIRGMPLNDGIPTDVAAVNNRQ